MKRGLIVALILCSVLPRGWRLLPKLEMVGSEEQLFYPDLILDAGHGGEDGGAISLSGKSESEINLAIVRKMDALVSFFDRPPAMTRNEDISLYTEGAQTLRAKKVSDLKNRVVMVESLPGAALISIHQNSYPIPSVHGFQAFYKQEEGSQQLAEGIQSAIQRTLQPDNHKKAGLVPAHVYLMKHISGEAVLLECGFLTNAEEERLLLEDSYQRKLAAVISSVWLKQRRMI